MPPPSGEKQHPLGRRPRRGKLSDAERYSREALETSRGALGDQHPDTADYLRKQHEALLELDRLDEVRTLLTDFIVTTDLAADHALRVEVEGWLEATDSPPSDEGR